ncbi:MAG: S-layer homology domain-containing protein [Candidatus Latescibacteria bacterium]|nr:S-layer homology domain-containing protein [Candidatus Latescibacterota bacterium]
MKPIKTTLSVSVAFVFTAVLMTACAGRIQQQSVLDTPEAHYQAGMELLRQQKVEEARAEFEYALGLDRDFAPGYEGLGLCELEWGRGREAEREFKRAIGKDRRYTPAHVGLGRSYNMQDRPRPAIRSFEDAIEIDARYAPAYEYLGQTHVQLRDFDSAVNAYRRGISALPTNTVLNDGWQRVSELQRATIGVPDRYIEIALTEAISRAELSVLLNEELDLEGIFVGQRTPEERRFAPPDQQQAQAQRVTAPNDVQSDHWARVHIEQVVKFGAMDLFPDGTFRPNQVVTRLDLALLIQRVLVEAYDDDSLKSKFFGNASPFPDVMNTHFSFNAVMLATTRGIMSGKPDGIFFLEGTLPGHEAILIVRNLKGALR